MAQSTELYPEIGKAISRQRRAATPKVSQEQLAASVGLSRASIVNIERGRHRIQIHTLYDIAQALGVDAHSLLPSTNVHQVVESLPAEFRRGLSAKELLAVGRMLKPRGDANAKP